LGLDSSTWIQAEVHYNVYKALPFSEIPFFGPRYFERRIPLGGNSQTIQLSHIFFSKHTPSITKLGLHGIGSANYRHVVDLGDLEASEYVMDSGVSESVFSKHFFDLNPLSNANGPWIPMLMGEHNAVLRAKHTIVMKHEKAAKDEL